MFEFDLRFYTQTADLKGFNHRRATNVSDRLKSQQEKLNLPILPTTTIGSFPQTLGLRKIRREYKANKYVVDSCHFIQYTDLQDSFITSILSSLLLCYSFRISEEEYVKAIKEEIKEVVTLQEELGIDVLVHGEPEVGQLLLFWEND